MALHHVYARTEFGEPLARLGGVESDDTPDLATAVAVGPEHLDDDEEAEADPDWLEVVTIADDALVWVIRDGDLTGPAAQAMAEEVAQ